jgi:hypothetical protein
MSARKRRQERQAESFAPDAVLPIKEADLFGDIQKADSYMPAIEEAIVQRSNGLVEIGGRFQLSSLGVTVDAAATENEWRAFFIAIKRIQEAVQWIVGDLLNYGETALNKTYDEMAEIIGYSPKTLREYAYVSRSLPMSIRMDTLSFGHHQLVASMPEHQQLSWLKFAEAKRLSVAALRHFILDDNSPTPPANPLADRVNKRAFGRLWRSVEQGRAVNQEDINHIRRWLDEIEGLVDRS